MARICFICISLRAGGTERVVTRLANDFCRKHDVSIITVQNTESFYALDERVQLYPNRLEKSGLPKWQRGLSMIRHIRSAVRRVQPDIILSFGELISPIARIATLGVGARFLIFNRESPLRSLRGRAGIINPMTYPLADGVVTQTEKAKKLLQARYRFSRLHVIPNPVEIPDEVRPIESRSRRIISVGYLGGDKNQQAVLRAFSMTSNRDLWRLTVVGDGPDKGKLEDLSRQLGIEDNVDFLGERKDVYALLSESRIFAFTSLSEGFPNALSEALAHGCACIAFDCVAGPSELIRQGRNGLLISPGDQRAYSDALDSLMCDEDAQVRYSRAANQDIVHFSTDQVFKQYAQLAFAGDFNRPACDS